MRAPSWSWLWSYSNSIYNYLCNQCLSSLKWVRTPLRRGVLHTTLCDKVCKWLVTGQWFSPGIPFSSTNKTDHHNITEILLKVALNTINHKPVLNVLGLYDFDVYFSFRCPQYLDIPVNCRLVIDPTDSCCLIPSCSEPTPTPKPYIGPTTPQSPQTGI